MNKQKTQGGFSAVLILVILVLAIVVASAASYYLLKSEGRVGYLFGPTPTPTLESSVSDSEDINTIEAELENTDIGNPDEDLNGLDSEASSL